MSFWSMQGAQRAAILMAVVLLFTYQLDEPVDVEASKPSAATATLVATDTTQQAEGESDGSEGPGLATYFCLLTCAIVVARQIRKRGQTHITLS
ncbi:hypothetical protein DM806_09170 [Sphingobium lactosutens]|uniref:hypothetical protein n=1 Tax=Sphingobium lactosutens TaxID=522773 RepID=UPI0015BA094E|nr:hypothetical protein [Sphingobium lactosutens]NWK95844.1 hypothetical protein [Sphingobium lactosutens]